MAFGAPLSFVLLLAGATSFSPSSSTIEATDAIPAAHAAALASPTAGDPAAGDPVSGDKVAVDKVDFVKDILPILKRRCFECHAGENDEGDLLLDDRSNVFSDEWDEPILNPGKPAESSFYKRIVLPADDSDIMPAEGDPLSKAEIAKVKQWILEGASWPEGAVAGKARKVVKREVLMLPARSAEAEKAIEAAAARIRASGGTAIRVAAKSNAYYVNLSLVGAKVNDKLAAELLTPMRDALVWLNLSRTKVSDAGARMLGDFSELRRLHLANTKVGDGALESLSRLGQLEYLNLYGTPVSDAGLGQLGKLSKLTKLFVWQTKISDKGLRAFRAARPTVRVDRGEYVAKLRQVSKEVEAAKRPVNVMCPIQSKRKADPKKIFRFKGQTVALCCSKCLGAFAKDPAKYWPQVVYRKGLTKPKLDLGPKSGPKTPSKTKPKAAKSTAAKSNAAKVKTAKASAAASGLLPALNAHCPVSGRPVDLVNQVALGDAALAFCCGNCKAKFVAELAKHPKAKQRVGPGK